MELRTDITYKRDILLMSICFVLSVLFMLFTNPQTMSVFLLLFLPVMVFLSTYFTVKLAFKLFSNFTEVRIKLIALVLGVGPTLIMILGSLGSIGPQDIILAILLVSGFSWYLRRFQADNLRP